MKKRLTRSLILIFALVTVLLLVPGQRAAAASLKQGSSGAEVKRLQQNLIGLGFLEGTADGRFGAMTAAAVADFQAEYGLGVDGKAGQATQTAVRNAVIRLQVDLNKLGYATGSADGSYGAKTRAAVSEFQSDRGLKATGVMDAAAWGKLNALSGGIRAGSKASGSTQVRYLQQGLIGLGYLSGTADGSFGSKTREAVRKFQSAYDLSADGSAGPDTMTALKNAVTTLQSDLARNGCYTGSIDSIYGNGTKRAVRAYQRTVGVTETGVSGPRTMVKLYGYSLGGSDSGESDGKTYKIWIDSLYQDGDYSKIWYVNGSKKSTTVHKSGCGGVALAMALNALLDTDRNTGQSVMQWYADNGYYHGGGTYQRGIWKYPRRLGLHTEYCDKGSTLVSHLKQSRLAVAIIKDKTGDEFFTYTGSGGHYILISGYRFEDGEDQIFVNNPLSWKKTGWFDLDDLMANVSNEEQGYTNSFVIIYK